MVKKKQLKLQRQKNFGRYFPWIELTSLLVILVLFFFFYQRFDNLNEVQKHEQHHERTYQQVDTVLEKHPNYEEYIVLAKKRNYFPTDPVMKLISAIAKYSQVNILVY